ncbi:MAG: orotate phosphoribosyltransferase, partial [Bifidobacteriaceae bacterium]|nr:orotate phosphoribosyltransferase [Bifidobacteriaceae bacterium]
MVDIEHATAAEGAATESVAAAASSQAAPSHEEFTQFLLECGALKFGSFTLKSGRQSPYFINAGSFNDGTRIARLGEYYAATIAAAQKAGVLPAHIDTVFGPAYKGIP